jgi:LysR family transcriptional regulator (chromosome initiation inhibitor)
MLPEAQAESGLADGSLTPLEGHGHQDVVLSWQTWTLDSERLNRLSRVVHHAARRGLRSRQRDRGAATPSRSTAQPPSR